MKKGTKKSQTTVEQTYGPLMAFTVGEVIVTYKRTHENVAIADVSQIGDAMDVARVFRSVWEENTMEYFESFYVLFVNRANQPIGWRQVSRGGVAGTVADPKIIFQHALLCNASGVIFAHNHPSGNLTPSHADIQMQKNLVAAGRLLEIQVLDHLIMTEKGHYSMANNGDF